MMGLLKLVGAGRWLFGLAGGVIRWLFAKWHRVALAVAAIIIVVLMLQLGSVRDARDTAVARAEVEAAAHLDTIAGYTAAAAEAQRLADANKATVEAAYERQAKEADHELATLRADHQRALADWLRRQRATADPGSSGPAGLSATAAVPGLAVHDAATAIVPVADLERCATGFAQLESLITYAKGIAAIETTDR